MYIRRAEPRDLSRIAEIFVFNNRVNYYPIFKDPSFSFGELQVVSLIDTYFGRDEVLSRIYVYDDGLVKGFVLVEDGEICKLYVDTFFQSQGIGNRLIQYAIETFHANHLWALEKNVRAIAFYERHGFCLTGAKQFEEGTTEYIVEMRRKRTP